MIAKQKNKKTKQTNKEFWRRPFLHRNVGFDKDYML